jgi:hypothetical protein
MLTGLAPCRCMSIVKVLDVCGDQGPSFYFMDPLLSYIFLHKFFSRFILSKLHPRLLSISESHKHKTYSYFNRNFEAEFYVYGHRSVLKLGDYFLHI